MGLDCRGRLVDQVCLIYSGYPLTPVPPPCLSAPTPCSRNHCVATLDLSEKLMLVIGRPSEATRAIAVLTPTMRPSPSKSGPPEFPRFKPVSV